MKSSEKIVIGSDHYGYPLKMVLIEHLNEKGYEVIDMGSLENEEVYYPEIAGKVCKEIQKRKDELNRGILVCGTGAGMAIVANKYRGIKAVCVHDAYTAERARMSNSAEIATFGSQVIGGLQATKLLDIWLESEFQGGRSLPKVEMINKLDENINN